MKRFILALNDIVILYTSLLATLIFRYGQGLDEQISFHLLPFSILFLIWLFIFYIANLYEISFLKNSPAFYGTFLKLSPPTLSLALLFSIFFLIGALLPAAIF